MKKVQVRFFYQNNNAHAMITKGYVLWINLYTNESNIIYYIASTEMHRKKITIERTRSTKTGNAGQIIKHNFVMCQCVCHKHERR